MYHQHNVLQRDIKSGVVTFWAKKTEAAQMNHNTFGYDPEYPPTAQGLPPLESELVRVGLKLEEQPTSHQ